MVKRILDTYNDKIIQENRYNTAISKYIEDSREFINLSLDGYSFLENLYWDIVMLKKYILSSDVLVKLQEDGIVCYTFEETKKSIFDYADTHNIDITTLKKAIMLYDTALEIAEIKEDCVSMMAYNLGCIIGMSIMSKHSDECVIAIPFLDGDKSIKEYENNKEIAYQKIEQLYFSEKILDDTAYSYVIEMINQVFNHYVNGIKSYSIDVDDSVIKRKTQL